MDLLNFFNILKRHDHVYLLVVLYPALLVLLKQSQRVTAPADQWNSMKPLTSYFAPLATLAQCQVKFVVNV